MSSSQQEPHSTETLQLPFLVRFYDPSIHAPDAHNRTLPTILSWPDSALEHQHDYIQLLFPLPEPSPMNPTAPIIDEATFSHFRSNPILRAALRGALERMLAFYGLESTSSPGSGSGSIESSISPTATTTNNSDDEKYTIHPSPSLFPHRSPCWVRPFNHNHLRITRIIRSLRVLGCGLEAAELYAAVKGVAVALVIARGPGGRGTISERSLGFWKRAAKQSLHVPPEEKEEDDGGGKDGCEGTGLAWLRGVV